MHSLIQIKLRLIVPRVIKRQSGSDVDWSENLDVLLSLEDEELLHVVLFGVQVLFFLFELAANSCKLLVNLCPPLVLPPCAL